MTHPLGKHRLALVPMGMGGGGEENLIISVLSTLPTEDGCL